MTGVSDFAVGQDSDAEDPTAGPSAAELKHTGRYGDRLTKVKMPEFIRRAQWAEAMDIAATELMVAAEVLVNDITLQRDAQYRVRMALEPKVKAWRHAVREYRKCGGLRNDNGGLRADHPPITKDAG